MVVSKRAADRQDDILALIRDRNRVYVTELSEKFQVSEVTIRKDLQELEQRGVAKRVHGGAINIYNTGIEPTLKELEQTNTDLKLAIAAKAFEYINDQDVLFLDASTTTRCLIPLICKHPEKKLTIITSSILTAADLSACEHVSLIMLGGNVRSSLCCVDGIYTTSFIREFHVDKVFFGANGFDVTEGITITNISASLVKRAMIENAVQVFLLADSSKYNCVTLSRVCPISRIDFLVTDDRLTADDVVAIEQQGVEVIIASANT